MNVLSCESINQLRNNTRSVVRELGLLNDAYFEIGVTLAERHLLVELSVCQSPTMGEIAGRLLLDKTTVSRLISKAVKKGYVRCKTDRKDKRKRFLQLTDLGKQTLKAFEPIAFNQTKEALLRLTPAEIVTVCEGIALYAKGLRMSRLQDKIIEKKPQRNESLSEIAALIREKGYALDLFLRDHCGKNTLFIITEVNISKSCLFE